MLHSLRTACFACATFSAACHVGGPDSGDLGTFSLAHKRQVEKPSSSDAQTLPNDPPQREGAEARTPTQKADASTPGPTDAGKAIDVAVHDAAISDAAVSDASQADASQPNPPAKSSWTMLGYDLGSTFNNSAETILSKQTASELRRRFTIEVGHAVYGAPLLVDDKLFYLGQEWAHALNIEDGTLIWEALLGDSSVDQIATNTMVYDEGKIYIHLRNADVMVLDAENGKTLWHNSAGARYDRGYGSPTVADNLVLVGRSPAKGDSIGARRFRGSLIAHDKSDGSMRWRIDTVAENESGAGIWSAPTVNLELGLVFVATGPSPSTPEPLAANGFMVVELATGALRFTQQLGLASDPAAHGSSGFELGASPIVFDLEIRGNTRTLMAAGTRTGTVHVIDANSGEYIWLNELGPGSDDGDTGILANGAWSGKHLLFAVNKGSGGGNGATLYALDPATGMQSWSRELDADVLGRITVANGVGFVGAGAQLLVFDVDDGSLISTLSTDGPTAAGVAAIANGIVAFGTGASYLAHDDAEQGRLYIYEVPQP